MSVASFIASQRTEHGVPHAVSCRALEVSESWFYKWRDRPPTPRQRRRAEVVAAIRESFEASDGSYGSPRVVEDCGRRAGRSLRTPSPRSWPKKAWSHDRSDNTARA
jgi:putative transposase